MLAACGFVIAATLAGGGVAGITSSSPAPTGGGTPGPTGPPTSPAPTVPTTSPAPTVPTMTTAPPTSPPPATTTTTTTTKPPKFEGCSHGFWKNHLNKWVGYSPDQQVKSVFAAAPGSVKNLTLLEGLKVGGGGEKALTREAIAALLNAAHPKVDYPLTTSHVIALVNIAFASRKNAIIESLKHTLEYFNKVGAPRLCN